MIKVGKCLAIIISLIGLVGIVVGSVFIQQSIEKSNWMTTAMRQEKVTLDLPDEKIKAGEVIDTPEELQKAADTIRTHRHNIAPTYQDLLGPGGKYDPTNPKQLTYSQAINMENYLYLGVLGFGVSTVILGVGAFMIISGLAMILTSIILFGIIRKLA
jgi:hypothetical protein